MNTDTHMKAVNAVNALKACESLLKIRSLLIRQRFCARAQPDYNIC